jgi:hypothetical protein
MATKKFVPRNLVIDNLHAGGRLCRMHTPKDGMAWFTLPAGHAGKAGRVRPEHAAEISVMPDIRAQDDGLLPGCAQTFGLVR